MSSLTILVAIDFSQQSELALADAMDAAKRLDGELLLLWVDDRQTSPSVLQGHVTAEVSRITSDNHRIAHEQLSKLAEQVKSRSIAVTTCIREGHPDETIAHEAEASDAAMIVTGTKGLTGFKHFFLGSVAEKVVRISHRNVLVARGLHNRVRNILVPTDFSPVGEKALSLAVEIADPDARIELFHAWQYPPGTQGVTDPDNPSGPMAAVRDQLIEINNMRAESLSKRHRTTGKEIAFAQEHGASAAVIQQRLDQNQYDLVVMGTHGYRGVRRFLLGSVAEATVRHAPCSVLVVHAAEEEAAEVVTDTIPDSDMGGSEPSLA